MIAKLAGTAPIPVVAILGQLEHDLDCLLADLAQLRISRDRGGVELLLINKPL